MMQPPRAPFAARTSAAVASARPAGTTTMPFFVSDQDIAMGHLDATAPARGEVRVLNGLVVLARASRDF
jgi:hypothetical protein